MMFFPIVFTVFQEELTVETDVIIGEHDSEAQHKSS